MYKSGRNKGLFHSHCRKCRNKSLALWELKNPWRTSYDSARSRCKNPTGLYRGKVKFLMVSNDFRKLWIRDKGYLLKKPSIKNKCLNQSKCNT